MDGLTSDSVSHYIFTHLDSQGISIAAGPKEGAGICAYCGNSFHRMVPMNRLELGRYTDWHLHRDRKSKYMCLPCVSILRNDDFRRKAVIADRDSIRFLRANQPQDREVLIRSIFYTPPQPPFVICLPSDYRKHIVLRAELNYSRSEFRVQFGELSAAVVPAIHHTVFEAAERLYKAGATAQQIAQKTYRAEAGHSAEPFLAPWRPSPILLLVLHLAKPVGTETLS